MIRIVLFILHTHVLFLLHHSEDNFIISTGEALVSADEELITHFHNLLLMTIS